MHFKDNLGDNGQKATLSSSFEGMERLHVQAYNKPNLKTLPMPTNCGFFNEDLDYFIHIWMQKKSSYTDFMLKIEVMFISLILK